MQRMPKAAERVDAGHEQSTQIAWDLSGDEASRVQPSHPAHCEVHGVDKSSRFAAKTQCEFKIVAHDVTGSRKTKGGEAFFVAIRGASRIRARIIDNDDGTYTCRWHAGVSGQYNLVVSLFGERIKGCPIQVLVCDPTPHAPCCEVKGLSLNSIVSRTPSTFEVRYRDLSGHVVQATDLDVYVTPLFAADSTRDEPPGGLHDGEEEDEQTQQLRAQFAQFWALSTVNEVVDAPPAVATKPADNDDDVFAQQEKRKKKKEAKKAAKVAKGASPSGARTSEHGEGVGVSEGAGGAEGADAADGGGGGTSSGYTPEDDYGAAAYRRPSRDEMGGGGGDGEVMGGVGGLSSGAEAAQVRRRFFPIQLPDKDSNKGGGVPLVVRKESSLDSEILCYLQPGDMAVVLEERLTQEGQYVRAKIAFDDPAEKAALRQQQLQQPQPHPPSSTASPRTLHGSGSNSAGAGQAPAVMAATPAPFSASGDDTSADVYPPVRPPPTPSTPSTPMTEGGFSVASRQVIEGNGMRAGAAAKTASSMLARRNLLTAASTEVNPGMVGPTTRPTARRLLGWATLRKNGKNLVTSRVRTDPWVRQQAALLWRLQTLNDRLQLDLQTEAALLDPSGVGFAFGGVHPGHLHSKGQILSAHKVSYSVDRAGKYLLHVRLRSQARPMPGSPFGLVVKPAAAHHSSTYLEPPTRPLRGEVGAQPGNGCTLLLRAHDRVGNRCDKGGAAVTIQSTGADTGVVTSNVTDNGDGSYLLSWQSRKRGTFETKVMINGLPVRGCPVRIELGSSVPEVAKSDVDGQGTRMAIAGEPALVEIKMIDQFDNPAAPGPEWTVGVAMVDGKTKMKLTELPLHKQYTGIWRDAAKGEYELSYTAEHAGHAELHLWWQRTDLQPPSPNEPVPAGARESFPGSPFSVTVHAGEPTAGKTYLDQFSIGHDSKKSAGGGKGGEGKKPPAKTSESDESEGQLTMIAGDTMSVRMFGVDSFDNPALMSEGTLTACVVQPDGSTCALEVVEPSSIKRASAQQQRPGAGNGKQVFEVRYEAVVSGAHELQVFLHGAPIKGSPAPFVVLPAGATPQQCELSPPENADSLIGGDLEQPSIAWIKTRDKFGNPCATGGLRIAGRMNLVKQSNTDNTILMPNNHSVIIEDLEDGTYRVKVACLLSCTVKLIVNMDKDLPGTSGELPPLQLTFIKKVETAETSPAGMRAGEA